MSTLGEQCDGFHWREKEYGSLCDKMAVELISLPQGTRVIFSNVVDAVMCCSYAPFSTEIFIHQWECWFPVF